MFPSIDFWCPELCGCKVYAPMLGDYGHPMSWRSSTKGSEGWTGCVAKWEDRWFHSSERFYRWILWYSDPSAWDIACQFWPPIFPTSEGSLHQSQLNTWTLSQGVLPFRQKPHRYNSTVDSLASPEVHLAWIDGCNDVGSEVQDLHLHFGFVTGGQLFRGNVLTEIHAVGLHFWSLLVCIYG